MPATDAEHALDNPIWSSLSTRHAHLALGGALARRYPPSISPLGALPAAEPANVAALPSLVEIGDDVAIAGPFVPPELPANWEMLRTLRVTQMIRRDKTPLPEGDVDSLILNADDVLDMRALIELTKPGPFRQRTIELGIYLGIREDGRLVAITGERTWVGDYREVSAVCTHPDAQGRGYARALMGRVINRMLRAGQTPYLHVESGNAAAIGLYHALGFSKRIEFPLLHARRVG